MGEQSEYIQELYDNEADVNELLQHLDQVCSEKRGDKHVHSRRRRRCAAQLMEEISFLSKGERDRINSFLIDETDSNNSASSVSSVSEASSADSDQKEQLCEDMEVDDFSSQQELINLSRALHDIKNGKTVDKKNEKREARRREIAAKKAYQKKLEAKELHDAIKRASREPDKNVYFLLQQVGFQKVYFPDQNQYALVWIDRHCYEIVLFKGVSSPSKKVICNEIGQRAWQYLRSGKFQDIHPEISKFLKEKRNTVKAESESETETSMLVQSLFDPDADNADDEADADDEANVNKKDNVNVQWTCMIM